MDDMKRFYEPDLTSNPDSPFIRDGNGKLVRRSYWMDMDTDVCYGDDEGHWRTSNER